MSRRSRMLLAVAFVLVGRGYAAADAITDWNAFWLATAVPAPVARPANEIGIAAGYMHIAIYDAIVAIDGGYTPFATTVSPVPPGGRKWSVGVARLSE